jgi:type II secretory pathway pseudopilin PulG
MLVGLLFAVTLGCGRGSALMPDAGGGAGSGAGDGVDAVGPGVLDAIGGSATLPDGKCIFGAFPHDGVCACQASAPTACGAACTDVTSDADNCGACGHACAANVGCIDGRCTSPVTNVVPAVPGCEAIDVAVGGGRLYWTDQGHGTVKSEAVVGGAATTISSKEPSPWLVTIVGSTLFWIDVVSAQPGVGSNGVPMTTTTATIRKATLPGGKPGDLVTETNLNGGIQGLVVSEDGSTLYYSADTDVKAIPVAGGAAVTVAHEALGGIPTALALHGSSIGYVTQLNGDVDVIVVMPGQVATCGTYDSSTQQLVEVNCTRVSRGQGSPLFTGIFIQGDDIYWSDDGRITVDSDLPDAGRDNQQVAGSAMGGVLTAMVGTPAFIYFSEDGFVERTLYAPGSAAGVIIARQQKAPTSIAVDETRVYWSTGDCAINSTMQ